MLPLATSIMHIQVLIHTSVFSYTTPIINKHEFISTSLGIVSTVTIIVSFQV